MKHLHLSLRVPPHRVEELLDRLHRVALDRGTLEIADLIDEYREDVYIEITDRKEADHDGRTPQDHLIEARNRFRSGDALRRSWD